MAQQSQALVVTRTRTAQSTSDQLSSTNNPEPFHTRADKMLDLALQIAPGSEWVTLFLAITLNNQQQQPTGETNHV